MSGSLGDADFFSSSPSPENKLFWPQRRSAKADAPDCMAFSTTAINCDRLAPKQSQAPALISDSIGDRPQPDGSTRSQNSKMSRNGPALRRAATTASAAEPPQPFNADKPNRICPSRTANPDSDVLTLGGTITIP